jgi:hypothetical protein
MIMLVSFVSAWGANRVIVGNNITVTINETGGTGIFTLQETIVGATVTSYPTVCGISGNVLICDSDDSTKRVINYMTSGTGTVSGIIVGGYPSTQKNVTGDNIIGASILPQIKINEFESDPTGTDSNNEWIELYNPNNFAVDIGGWKIYDVNGTSGLKFTVPASTSINAYGYFVADGITSLNNNGESVILKNASDVIIDQTPEKVDENNDNRTWQRVPDGGDNWQFKNSTRGFTNNATTEDTTPPVITNINAVPTINSAAVTWNTNENANSSVSYGKTTSLGSTATSTSLVTSHSINLNGLDENTLYYYKVKSCDASGNCAESSMNNFTTLENIGSNVTDDLMVNYVRGKIMVDGIPVTTPGPFVEYQILVLNGANAGYIYTGQVDENIPAELQGNGYFFTEDNVNFNTGDSFRVSLTGYDCSVSDVFENGGNGEFEPETNLIVLNCITPNGEPILDEIGNKSVDEGQLLEFTVHAIDPESQELFYSVIGLPPGASFNSSTRVFSWTPDYDDYGLYYMTFNVTDGVYSDSEDIVITVNNVNRAPVINMAGDYNILKNTNGNATINASDPDGDSLSYSIGYENPSQVDCEIVGNLVYFFPYAEWTGDALCILQASDGNLTTDKNLNIDVLPGNQPPVLVRNIPHIEWYEGTVLTNQLNLSYYFRDNDSALTYSVSGNNHINVSINNDFVSFSAPDGWYGTETVVFRASDGEYNVSSNNVNLTVIHVGVPPSFLPLDCEKNILEDTSYNCTLEADNPETTQLVFSITSQSNLNCTISGNNLSYKSYLNYNGEASCSIQVSNGYGVDDASLNVSISGVPDFPVLSQIGNKNASENSSLAIQLNATDADIPYGDVLSYEIIGLPAGASFNSTTGKFEWTPDIGQRGNYTLTFIVRDGFGLSDNETITINVARLNRLPVIQDIDDINIDEESEASFNVSASDEDNDNLTYSISQENTLQVDCSINSLTGEAIVRGSSDFFGRASCTLRVSDGIGYSEKIFYINVENVPDAPEITSYSPANNPRIVNGTNQNFAISARDADNDPLMIVWYLNGLNVSILWNYIFNQAVNGNYNLTAIVTDGIFDASHEWNVFVGSLVEFNCSEVNGFICNSEQICEGSILDTYDSSPGNICCSQQCSIAPPDFTDADTCKPEDKSSLIEVNIKEPDNNEEFELGDNIDVEIKIRNNLEDDDDFEVSAYLYDISDDEVIDEETEDIDIESGDSEEIEFSFNASYDLDDKNDFAVLVVANSDENETCNQNYVLIDVKRNKNDIIFKDVQVNPETAICGDIVNVNAKLQNIGTRDEDNIYMTLENSELGIKEKSEYFSLEEYDDKDTTTQSLSFVVPENAVEGTYNLKLKIFYSDETEELVKEISIGKCLKEETKAIKTETKPLELNGKQAVLKKLTEEEQIMLLILILAIGIVITSLAIIVVARRY